MADSLNFKIALTGLLGLLLCFQGSHSQGISISSPSEGATITPGQKLNVVLNITSTTSSLEYIAFSSGFKTTKYNDSNALGRPYVGSVFPQQPGNEVTLDSSKRTYTYEITVPQASNFSDGLPGKYQFTVSTYYLLGATYTPKLQLYSVEVNVQDGNGTSTTGASGGTNTTTPGGTNTTTPIGNNPPPPTSGSAHLKQPLFVISTFLALFVIGLIL